LTVRRSVGAETLHGAGGYVTQGSSITLSGGPGVTISVRVGRGEGRTRPRPLVPGGGWVSARLGGSDAGIVPTGRPAARPGFWPRPFRWMRPPRTIVWTLRT